MASANDDPSLRSHIRKALSGRRKPISYGALAQEVDAAGPGSIARVTSALEQLMVEDAAAGRPFLAAICAGKLTGDLPALGFFQKAAELGRYSGPAVGPEALAFVLSERKALNAAAD